MGGNGDLKTGTVRELMDQWMEWRHERLRESSYMAYLGAVQNHIIPALGGMKLSDLSRSVLRDFIEGLFAGGLSEKTVWDINVKLNAALQWAVDNGYLEHAAFCVKMKCGPFSEPKNLTEMEYNRLTAYLSAGIDPIRAGILLCLKTGILVGELCALRWPNIDLENGKITIDARMQRITRPADEDGGKTRVKLFAVDRRQVPAPPELRPVLQALPHGEKDYFLTGRADSFYEPRRIQYKLKSYLKDCGIRDSVGFNVLRSTFIQVSLKQGGDLYSVSKSVGAKRVAHIGYKYRAVLEDVHGV